MYVETIFECPGQIWGISLILSVATTKVILKLDAAPLQKGELIKRQTVKLY